VRVVFDAFSVRSGSSAVILEGLLRGWRELAPEDRLTVVASEPPRFALADGVELEIVDAPLKGTAGNLWNRSAGTRRITRRLKADALVSGVTASAFFGAPCPRGVILTDLRHEVKPEQFSAKRRLVRRVSYAWSFRSADRVFCISDRTRQDLIRQYSWAADTAVTARLGADHVDAWPVVERDGAPYALAFGHFANKNVDAVLDAWAEFCRTDEGWSLRLIGMGRADREAATARVAELGIADRVQLMPWLDDDAFRACFAGAGLVVFPSEFEGFGLPPVEAMRLGIPVVVSTDPALLEMSAGHAEVAADLAPAALASSIARAVARTPAELEAARRHTDSLTWAGMAETVRSALMR
jgi:glycosyltransferase involved in cell wall biosynthesis